jgi:hypothetical protein
VCAFEIIKRVTSPPFRPTHHQFHCYSILITRKYWNWQHFDDNYKLYVWKHNLNSIKVAPIRSNELFRSRVCSKIAFSMNIVYRTPKESSWTANKSILHTASENPARNWWENYSPYNVAVIGYPAQARDNKTRCDLFLLCWRSPFYDIYNIIVRLLQFSVRIRNMYCTCLAVVILVACL